MLHGARKVQQAVLESPQYAPVTLTIWP